jgi:hypothetical protein
LRGILLLKLGTIKVINCYRVSNGQVAVQLCFVARLDHTLVGPLKVKAEQCFEVLRHLGPWDFYTETMIEGWYESLR